MRTNHAVLAGVRRSSEYYVSGMLPVYKDILQANFYSIILIFALLLPTLN